MICSCLGLCRWTGRAWAGAPDIIGIANNKINSSGLKNKCQTQSFLAEGLRKRI